MASETSEGLVSGHDGPTDQAVVVRDLTVEYQVLADRHDSTLRARVANTTGERRVDSVVAVRDVSFTLRRGEVLGVVGSNGSGKSTLVRTIAGLHPPSKGQILVGARPTLIGVGAVLQPKLSGARNVMLGCLALGMSRDEAREQFDSIVEFSGIGEAIHRPMRTYSSGMRARLHFAIATAIAPEILLVDEALAVGDRDFKRRSLQRLRAMRDQAGAVIMVSHNLREIRKVANSCIWLDKGRLMASGDPENVVRAYKESDAA